MVGEQLLPGRNSPGIKFLPVNCSEISFRSPLDLTAGKTNLAVMLLRHGRMHDATVARTELMKVYGDMIKGLLVTIFLIGTGLKTAIFAVEFHSINSIYGISVRATNSICKDKDGFIWASSKTGILRLADNDARVYRLPFENSGAVIVRLIYENSRLTAYTNDGQLFSYNAVLDRFELLVNLGNLPGQEHFDLFGLLVHRSGDYWVALSTGLYRFRAGRLSLMREAPKGRYSICWFDEDQILLADGDGVHLLDVRSPEGKLLWRAADPGFVAVSSLFLDKQKEKLWVGTSSDGLFCYDFRSKATSPVLGGVIPRQPVLALEANSDSTLLAGIDGQGIWEVDREGRQLLNVYKENADEPHSLRGNGVYDIFCDDTRRVWICTISGGVSFFDQASPLVNQIVHQINNSNSLTNNDVNSILEDREGNVWYATNNGISLRHKQSGNWKSLYNNNLKQAQVFLTLCGDDQGRIWAGSYSSGIYVLDGRTGRELAHYSGRLPGGQPLSRFIFDIFRDSEGDLWIGGIDGGFACYLSKEDKFQVYDEEPISSFAELTPGKILLGCSYGLSLLDKQSGVKTSLLTGNVVQDMLVLGDEVWICTSGEGLLVYNHRSGERKRYTTNSGLPSDFLNSIVLAEGYLWIGTENGLCRFDPADKTTLVFSSTFPLLSISCNKSSMLRLRNGRLALGTNDGVVVFPPGILREQPSKGRIFFQDLTIAGTSIRDIPRLRPAVPVDSLRRVDLRYFQNTFNLEVLPVGVPLGAKFRWKMTGFDQEWTAPSANRIINYTNIPDGQYTLEVKLYDSSLTHVLAQRSVALRVIPPFWRKGWFLTLAVIAGTGLIFLFFLFYINHLRQVHSEEKIRFFTNTAHDIRTSLTLIKAPVEELNREVNLSEAGRHYLQLAIKQMRQLSTVATQLMDFQKTDVGKGQRSLSMVDIVSFVSLRKVMYESYAQSNDVELVFESDREHYLTGVDEVKMEKIVDNLISNAVKYSHPSGKVHIGLTCLDNKWVLQVADQGIGISRQGQRRLFKEFYRSDNAVNSKIAGSGIGLLLVRNYVGMHGGRIECSSELNAGTTFRVVIPYKEVPAVAGAARQDDGGPAGDEVAASFPAALTAGASKAMKVLLVEDNDELLAFMKRSLSRDFEVFTATDGAEAWEFVRTLLPDLVVSDIMMPRMDGFELCSQMKSTWETSHIPLILLTALSEKTEQMRGLGLGADDYLTKPFDTSLLTGRIRSLIRNREAVREKALKLVKGNSSAPILENELNERFLRKMLEVVKANISNNEFSKDEFASAMNVSSSLLYKKVKSLTSQSPTDFIKAVRLTHALELLQEGKNTVTEVSELCGFTSIGYFSTVFKKHFRKSPSEI